jgi:pectate lyase
MHSYALKDIKLKNLLTFCILSTLFLITNCTTSSSVIFTSQSFSNVEDGWASYTGNKDLAGKEVTPPDLEKGTIGGQGGKVVTVKTREQLLKYAKSPDRLVIYIDGMIDMSNNMLPSTYNSSSRGLDTLIKTTTKSSAHECSSYKEWKKEYAKQTKYSENQKGSIATVQNLLSSAWKKQVRVPVTSDKTIIGLTANSGIMGGSFSLSNTENIILRNLTILEAYDPFPKMEENDGLNAQIDGCVITRSRYIWVDHCTFKSSFTNFDYIKTSDNVTAKWQVYDGLLDINKGSDFITVSWCKFVDHDKTMLIGSSDDDIEDDNHLTVTVHHNYFLGCRQRLPMVRYGAVHVYNNYYKMNGKLSSSYVIDVRYKSKIVAQNNYIEPDIKNSFKGSEGLIYLSQNIDNSSSGSTSSSTNSMPWNPSQFYNYSLDSAKDIPRIVIENAGAGVK